MTTQKPRIIVTFRQKDVDLMRIICEEEETTMSGFIRSVIERWLEAYRKERN